MRERHLLLRRLAVFVMAILVLSLAGLGLLLFRWWGERGAPPVGRLYVNGDFEGDEPLVVLRRSDGDSACYDVAIPPLDPDTPPLTRVCRGKSARIWVDDARLHLSVGARGVPRVSTAGLKAREGDRLGSLADRKRPHPRYPIRGYGVPAITARVVACDAALCLESRDRVGRLALVRAEDRRVVRLGFGVPQPVRTGDVLWLGLVAFEARLERGGDNGPALVLERIDRLRPRRRGGDLRATQLGGDRRWLGRLWHVEAPDPADEMPERFEIHPMHHRYTTHDLSRQRTNFEGEDVIQRLIDGGWLCLDRVEGGLGDDDRREVVWRALERPGCGGELRTPGVTRSAMEDYQRARHGDLSFLSSSLVAAANAALADGRYLDDASVLPFSFDWKLADLDRRFVKEGRAPLPVPHRLWGVRFGVTRQIRRSAAFNRGNLPAVYPRGSTGRHVVQVLRSGELVASVYMPAPRRQGALCLGTHSGDAEPLRETSGTHHPLGSVAFADDPSNATWSADTDATCEGCRLELEVTGAGDLEIARSGACEDFNAGRDEGTWRWRELVLRHVDRGRPWLAATDPGTRRRHFAEEFYLHGGLRPLLGDEAGLSGVEAALAEYLADAGEIGVDRDRDAWELTIDGDLQLAAAAIVDAVAGRHVTAANDPDSDRVSVTAAILDARGGDLLAAVNWSRRGSERARRHDWVRPTAWELGSGQADVLENAALLRRGPVGSTMKVTGSYALLNNGGEGLVDGAELAKGNARHAFVERGERGNLWVQRAPWRSQNRRRCSTGPHYLPADDRGYTEPTFVRRFAESCNNFFVLTGFRHASHSPAELGDYRGVDPASDELLIRSHDSRSVLVHPSNDELLRRLRDGLRDDFAAGRAGPPRSIFGVLFRLGFQPRFELAPRRGEVPAELSFDHGGPVVVPLVHDWFAPTDGLSTPALEPGRDFAYLGVPSPGRMDEATVRGAPVTERYDGEAWPVRRDPDQGRADVQYSMLSIGQSSVEVSAVGLATLYAPAARGDGHAVSPCLFRANCGAARQGASVLADGGAEVLNEALRAVVEPGGTAHGGLFRIGLRDFSASGWGGKTGTYQVERREPVGMTRAQWRQLRAWACGVENVRRPRVETGGLTAGGALGSDLCEEPDLPLNPAGVHGYQDGRGPRILDALATRLEEGARKETEIFHSFVAVAPPRRGEWPEVDNPAQGIVVAVLVDRQTEEEKSIAVQIAGELAAAVERWAKLAR